ncbi:MAG: hypothetical protein PHW08_00585 [Kiritimatiellae bacterium]|nr:hypothetical protein [Kiritimatiellia bacterium]
MKNPTRALAAFTAPPSVKVGPYEVREITLGLAGVLEAIESPLVTGRKPQRPMEWAATLFAMTRSTEESERLLASGREAYAATAKAWADTVPLAHARRMLEAVLAAGKRLADVSPDEDDDGETGGDAAPGNSPAATAGSSPSPRSAPNASAGTGAS